MAPWSRRVLLLAALVTTTGCRHAAEPAPAAMTPSPSPSDALAPPPPPDSPPDPAPASLLTLRTSSEPAQWFEPTLLQMSLFDVGGTPYLSTDRGVAYLEESRVVTVPITFVEPPPRVLPEVVRIYGHHPSPLWFDQINNGVARTVVPHTYRQGPDGRFVEAAFTSGKAIVWDDDRMLTLSPSVGAMRWVDATGNETPAALRGPSPDCVWQPGPRPVTSRGWVLTSMKCSRPEPRQSLWLFDPSAHGRPIAGLDDHEAQSMIVLADGETWFTAAPPAQTPLLCHLVGDHARCDKIPTTSPWARSLGGRESALSFAARDGIWTRRSGSFRREPLLLPNGAEARLDETVRDRSGRLWGVVDERPGAKKSAMRLFVRSP